MNGLQVSVKIITDFVMLVGGIFVFIQNYFYWRRQNNSDSIYWCVLGALVALLGVVAFVTVFMLPSSIDQHVVVMLTMVRRVLFAVVLLFVVAIGVWEYMWKR